DVSGAPPPPGPRPAGVSRPGGRRRCSGGPGRRRGRPADSCSTSSSGPRDAVDRISWVSERDVMLALDVPFQAGSGVPRRTGPRVLRCDQSDQLCPVAFGVVGPRPLVYALARALGQPVEGRLLSQVVVWPPGTSSVQSDPGRGAAGWAQTGPTILRRLGPA